MSSCMKSNSTFLKFLYQANKNQRIAVLSHITKKEVDVLSEIALNIYKGVFPNKKKYVKPLESFKSIIWKLGSKSVSRHKKKKLLIRYNKVLPSLLRPVLDFI